MASFQPLEPREEDELHKSRLLNVEEKPFKRITKRLLTPGSLISTPSKLPTPPPDTDTDSFNEAAAQKLLEDRRQFREDVLLDFAAFDSSISRIQFLYNSNIHERERYQADKQRILDTAQEVRDSTAQLRIQLEDAKKTLEQRKKFDELTEKITNNKLLRPRADQELNLRKLEEECRELEKESKAYAETWVERREQFGRIVEEGMQLRRLIRDEKEEVERREGMNDGGEEDGEVGETGSSGGQTPKPRSVSGNATPRPDAPVRGGSPDIGLKPRPTASGGFSRAGSRTTSRAPSPSESRREGSTQPEDMMTDGGLKIMDSDVAVDTPMGEAETPRVTIDEPSVDGHSTMEEGEDKMDTT
ncbi:Tho complex subunit 7-domain-containing protein [Tricladium varicosporioides]|nr:Tho complex subunit 7-domain-containing protein [Hymenoscyphus varicosporioides]